MCQDCRKDYKMSAVAVISNFMSQIKVLDQSLMSQADSILTTTDTSLTTTKDRKCAPI